MSKIFFIIFLPICILWSILEKTYDDEMMKNIVIIDINHIFEVNIIKLSFDIKF